MHKEIFARIPQENLYSSNKEAIAKLENSEGGTVGVVMESGAADYWLNSNCDYYATGNLATRFYALAGAKGTIKNSSNSIFLSLACMI